MADTDTTPATLTQLAEACEAVATGQTLHGEWTPAMVDDARSLFSDVAARLRTIQREDDVASMAVACLKLMHHYRMHVAWSPGGDDRWVVLAIHPDGNHGGAVWDPSLMTAIALAARRAEGIPDDE